MTAKGSFASVDCMAIGAAIKRAEEVVCDAENLVFTEVSKYLVTRVMRRTDQQAGISQGLWGVDSGWTQRMVVACRSPLIRPPATGCRTARTARQERRMRKSRKERWEDEFRPENLNNTLLKVLFAVAFIFLLVWIVGWEYYFWPVPITVTYYLTRIALVKIRMRRNQER